MMTFAHKLNALVMTGAFLFLLIGNSYAQLLHPRDSSYTVKSAYEKYKKRYPQIEIAKAVKTDSADVILGLAYKDLLYRSLKMDAFLPKDVSNKTKGVIVLIHGGGWSSGDRSHMHQMALAFASNGYLSFTPEYRLSTEAQYPSGMEDLGDALAWIKTYLEENEITNKTITLLGCSSGGQMASLLGLRLSHWCSVPVDVKAIINMDGVLAFDHPISKEGARASQWLGGDLAVNKKIWDEASPMYYASKGAPRMLFLNSDKDRFHAGRDELIEELSSYGVKSEVYTFSVTPHTFWLFTPWFSTCIEKSLNFIENP